MSISQKIKKIKKELQLTGTTLVAVSKTKSVEMIEEAYATDQRIFGENKVQELVEKHKVLPIDIEWHMIGHLQRNKVKYIAQFVHLIHGVDTPALLKEINKQGKKNNRIIPCLLQVYIAKERTKFGFSPAEACVILTSDDTLSLENVMIVGLMGMATNTADTKQVENEFKLLHQLYQEIRGGSVLPNVKMTTLSMGMSGDYQLAVAAGSTMVRIGSTIFGERNYHS